MDCDAPGGGLVYSTEEPGALEVAGHLERRELESHVWRVSACPRELLGNHGSGAPFLAAEM